MSEKYVIDKTTLVGIADAIREKTGGTDEISALELGQGVRAIESGVDTADATVTSAMDIPAGLTAYGAEGKIEGEGAFKFVSGGRIIHPSALNGQRIAVNGNQIVIPTQDGILRSTDYGFSWEVVHSDTSTFYDVFPVAGGFLVLLGLKMYHDNSSWSLTSLRTPSKTAYVQWYDSAHGNGVSVLVGDSEYCLYALDSKVTGTWTAGNMPADALWTSTTYGNGIFVAISSNGRCAYSTDNCATWAEGTMSETGGSWRQVVYGNGVFVAVGSVSVELSNTMTEYRPHIAYSTDGNTWTVVTITIENDWSSHHAECIVYDGDRFIIFTDDNALLVTSEDGINWSVVNEYTTTNAYFRDVVYTDKGFIGIDTNSEIKYSSTGDVGTWSNKFPLIYNFTTTDETYISADDCEAQQLRVVDGELMLGDPAPDLPFAYSESGAISTGVELVMPIESRWRGIAYGNGRFVAVGATSNQNGCAYSDDGINWTDTPIVDTLSAWHDIAFGGGRFVAVSERQTAAYSDDGITWISTTMPSNQYWNKLCYGNGCFVAIVATYNSNYAAYSYDGITWNATSLPVATNWESITYGNGRFVIVGRGANAAYSEDGITWTTASLPDTSDYKWAVTFGSGRFVAVKGYTTVGAYSEDGMTWVATTTPAQQNVKDIAYGNNRFVAISAYASVQYSYDFWYSEDGITWSTTPAAVDASWTAVEYGNNMFVAVADGLGTDTTGGTVVSQSPDGTKWYNTATETVACYEVTEDKIYLKGHNGETLRLINNDTTFLLETDWVGELTFSGTNAGKATHYTEKGCSLAVDPVKGMAFVTIRGGTNTGYENIYFQTPTVPEGVTFLTTQTYGGPTGGAVQRYFTAAFTGITGKINVDVAIGSQNTSYDYVPATIKMTYA